jgi:hypothetical protein
MNMTRAVTQVEAITCTLLNNLHESPFNFHHSDDDNNEAYYLNLLNVVLVTVQQYY